MTKAIAAFALALATGAVCAQTAAVVAAPKTTAERLQQAENRLADWAQLGRYRDDNAHLAGPVPGEARVVFFGDSITEHWALDAAGSFPGQPYVNRGIHGQTTAQLLLRFRADVVALKPRAVVILAGTNDLAGKTGPSSPAMIEDNLASMTEIAQANGIRVVLASLLPVNDYVTPRTRTRSPREIDGLNAWIEAYARRKGFIYLDYHDALTDAHGALRKECSDDGLHPNAAGYAVMAPLARNAIARALAH